MKDHSRTPDICASCGAEAPPGAAVCPECGANEQTGWNEKERVYGGIDLPDEDADPEFGDKPGSPGRNGRIVLTVIFLIIVVVTIIVAFAIR